MLCKEIREKIIQYPNYGAGNFIHVASEVVPDPNAPYYIQYITEPWLKSERGLPATLSLNDIRRLSLYIGEWYRRRNICSQDLIGIYLRGNIDYYWHYLGLNNIGAIPVLVNGQLPEITAAEFFADVGVRLVVTDADRLETVKRYLGNGANVTSPPSLEDSFYSSNRDFVDLYQHRPDDIVVICHTSGTTGTPKPVAYRHKSMCYGVDQFLMDPPEFVSTPVKEGTCKILSLLPNAHHSSLTYFMRATLAQISFMVVETATEATIKDAITRFKPSVVISFPYRYVSLSSEKLNTSQHSFDSIAWWVSIGDAAHQKHINSLIRYGYSFRNGMFEPGSTFIDCLASSEMGSALFRVLHTSDSAHQLRYIGEPLEWVDVEILSDNGSPVKTGEVGMLAVRAPTVASYWQKKCFDKKFWFNDYLLTGDLVYRDAAGSFFHVDRTCDAIKTRTGILYSVLAEEVLLDHFEEIDDCVVVGVPEYSTEYATPVVFFIFFEQPPHADLVLLRAHINQLFAARNIPKIGEVRFAKMSDMPIGPTGKVRKCLLREK
ncbi:MAG: AMP-binding protein [Porticoccaceae bacterium]